jgi:hypothetical protein
MISHVITENTTPVHVIVRCSCGWQRMIKRRQKPIDRRREIRDAWREHIGSVVLKAPITPYPKNER